MIIQTITFGEITGRIMFNLPNRKIVKEAQRNLCMSPSFWNRIRKGDIPYIYNKDTGEFLEANYTETVSYLNKGIGEVYWVSDEEYPRVKLALEETYRLSQEINKRKNELKKYRK
jgi:hypothetical protein